MLQSFKYHIFCSSRTDLLWATYCRRYCKHSFGRVFYIVYPDSVHRKIEGAKISSHFPFIFLKQILPSLLNADQIQYRWETLLFAHFIVLKITHQQKEKCWSATLLHVPIHSPSTAPCRSFSFSHSMTVAWHSSIQRKADIYLHH